MSSLKEQVTFLDFEKLELREKLDLLIFKSGKTNGEATNLQVQLENNLNTIENRLYLDLERNN